MVCPICSTYAWESLHLAAELPHHPKCYYFIPQASPSTGLASYERVFMTRGGDRDTEAGRTEREIIRNIQIVRDEMARGVGKRIQDGRNYYVRYDAFQVEQRSSEITGRFGAEHRIQLRAAILLTRLEDAEIGDYVWTDYPQLPTKTLRLSDFTTPGPYQLYDPYTYDFQTGPIHTLKRVA